VSDRTKTLLLPGLVGLTASMLWMMILQGATLRPGHPGPWLHSGLAFTPYLVWLAVQPLFGGASAYLSRRAGGGRQAALMASLFPSVVIFAVWVVLLIFIVVTRYSHVSRQWALVLASVVNWAVFPGLLLLLGGFLYAKVPKLTKG
jgi:hypothetical protein